MIISGNDGTVRMWQLADGTPVGQPPHLHEPVEGVAAHGNIIVTAAGADIAVHQPALPRLMRLAGALFLGTTTAGETIG